MDTVEEHRNMNGYDDNVTGRESLSSDGADSNPSEPESPSKGDITGRWSASEHELFIQGIKFYGKNWKKIADLIPCRTVVQIRTHAQKHFQKLDKNRPLMTKNGEVNDFGSRYIRSDSMHDLNPGTPTKSIGNKKRSMTLSSIELGSEMHYHEEGMRDMQAYIPMDASMRSKPFDYREQMYPNGGVLKRNVSDRAMSMTEDGELVETVAFSSLCMDTTGNSNMKTSPRANSKAYGSPRVKKGVTKTRMQRTASFDDASAKDRNKLSMKLKFPENASMAPAFPSKLTSLTQNHYEPSPTSTYQYIHKSDYFAQYEGHTSNMPFPVLFPEFQCDVDATGLLTHVSEGNNSYISNPTGANPLEDFVTNDYEFLQTCNEVYTPTHHGVHSHSMSNGSGEGAHIMLAAAPISYSSNSNSHHTTELFELFANSDLLHCDAPDIELEAPGILHYTNMPFHFTDDCLGEGMNELLY